MPLPSMDLLGDLPPDQAKNLVIAILKMQAVMKQRMEQRMAQEQAMKMQLEEQMLREKLMGAQMNKMSMEKVSSLLGEGLIDNFLKKADTQQILKSILGAGGGGLAGGALGGLLGAGTGALSGGAAGGLYGLFESPDEGMSKWDMIKKRMGQGAGVGAAAGAPGGMLSGGLHGASMGADVMGTPIHRAINLAMGR